MASVEFDPDESMHGPCLGAATVNSAMAQDGLGPLVYDIAMEVTGGLISDRTEVSNAARDVWHYYDKKRPDIIKQQMDDLYNFLTPEERDNCEQITADQDDSVSSWQKSSLSKKYSKPKGVTPVIDELTTRGLIWTPDQAPIKNTEITDFPADGMTPSKYDGDTHPGGIS